MMIRGMMDTLLYRKNQSSREMSTESRYIVKGEMGWRNKQAIVGINAEGSRYDDEKCSSHDHHHHHHHHHHHTIITFREVGRIHERRMR
jgi:hypothetical protein